jgi:hypothetical protein
MKTLFKILGIILLLLVVLIVVVIIRFDPDELGQRVLTWVDQETDIDLEAERFALHPLKGLELVNAEVHTVTPSGDVTVNLDRLLFEHEVWPLLKGELVIHRILLEKPQIQMVSVAEPVAEGGKGSGSGAKEEPQPTARAESAEPAVVAEGDTSGLSVSIAEIRIEDGSLVARTEGATEDELELQGLDLLLSDLLFDSTAPSSIEGFAAQGGISVESIRLGEIEAKGTEGRISIDRGQTAITEFGLSTANGELQVDELAVDVTKSPATYNLILGGAVDLNGLLGAEGDGGFGPVQLEFGATGEGPETEDLAGQGVLHLAAGSIPTTEAVAKIEKLLQKPLVSGNAYEATDIPFEVVNNHLVIQPFEIVGTGIRIAGAGTVDLAGPVSAAANIRVPGEGLTLVGIPPDALRYMTDDEGFMTVPFIIGGTMEEVDVSLDSKAITASAKDSAKTAVEDYAKEEGKKLLGKLFGKDKGDG